jgi:hypothetical protein
VCAQGYSTGVGVDLDQIDDALQPASQMRAKLDDEAVQSYAEILDSLPPVLLIYDPVSRKHWVVDGGHRLTAARLKNRPQVQAIVKTGSYLEAFHEAAHANDANPVRVTNADKRHRVEVALKHPEMSKWSNPLIAETCGVSKELVRQLKSDPIQPATVAGSKTVGRDGKARKPPKPRKSKPAGTPAPQPDTSSLPTPVSQPTAPLPEGNATPPESPADSRSSEQGDKQRVNGWFTDEPTAANPTEPEEESEPAKSVIDWDEEWKSERRLIMERYHAWPEDARATFAMNLEWLGMELCRKYHPEIEVGEKIPLA